MRGTWERRAVAEFAGTALLVTAVVGSGIMAQKLSGGNVALALLCNTIATGAALVVLISLFGPISGAHFNPVVTLVMTLKGEMTAVDAVRYVLAQIAGGIFGTLMAHAMFALPLLQASTTARHGGGQWISEAVATFGLLAVILIGRRMAAASLPTLIGLYISAAYWFTASTSFANPAVTIARSMTDTFAGIAPGDVAGFLGAQVIGAIAAMLFSTWLIADGGRKS